MNKKINIGIVGCGRVSQHYKKIFLSHKIKNFQIIFCCDIDIVKAKYLASYFNADYGISYRKMIKKYNFDLIIILTESGKHFKLSKFFLENKVNILIEKPATFFYKESKILHDISSKHKLLCSVAFQNRFNPCMMFLKKTILENRFGKIITASVKLNWCRLQNYYNDGWHGSWYMDGGVTNQQAIHHIDAINWLLGPVKSAGSFMTKRLNSLEAEDTMTGILYFKSGVLATIEATTSARPKDFEASIAIMGEKGRVKIGGIALNKIIEWNFIKKRKSDSLVKNKYSIRVPNGYGIGHYKLIQNIIYKLLYETEKETVPIDSTFNTTNLISGLYRSSETSINLAINNKTTSKKLGKKHA